MPRARLLSVDALRGFDMFWILGADGVAQALRGMENSPLTMFLATQLDHSAWEGFTFYDLIFPLFVFIVGVTTVFSLPRIVAQRGRGAAVKRIVVRTVLLFLFGLYYSGGLSVAWADIRWVGVLQRIAIAYAATALSFLFFKTRTLVAIAAALLVGYWALMTFVPIRDVALDRDALVERLGPDKSAGRDGRPSLEYLARVRALYAHTTTQVTGAYGPGRNLANHVDYHWLPGAAYDRYWDPEGLLSTLPAIATCLLGVFAGLLLRRTDIAGQRKAIWLAAAGLAALLAGYLWGLEFPVVKKIWTSSYVLVAGGWSLVLLAGFYYAVDVRHWQRWCTPFFWIGMNPITLYLTTSAVSVPGNARRFVGGSVQRFFDTAVAPGFGELMIWIVTLALLILLARFLYRRGIFLRV